MNLSIKNTLAVTGSIALVAIAITGLMIANTYGKSVEPSSYRSFSVSGEGTAYGIPDVATFSVGVTTEGGTNLGALQEENTEKINAIIAFLKDNGVAKEDITTSSYNVSPRYQYYRCDASYDYGASSIEPCPPADIVGYTINQRVSVKARDFEVIGTLLSGVVDAGANSVSSLSFEIDDADSVESEARAEAITKARAKAEAVAQAGGFSVGRILDIYENSTYPRYDYAYTEDSVGFGMGGNTKVAPTIEPGSEEVNVNVTIRFEIK
ncbi:MAG: SIMPL domain-containing protein [Parcubacteria group bacterium]|nr:SIMPL domain-containing protein [Parcubacteria group bacterium]